MKLDIDSFLLSAVAQVRSEMVRGEYLFSDRTGQIFDATGNYTFKPVGDIQNKLLSPKRTAMLEMQADGNVTIKTGLFDTNAEPIATPTEVWASAPLLANWDKIGFDKKPYQFGFIDTGLSIKSLAQNKIVGTIANVASYTSYQTTKVRLQDDGDLQILIGSQLYWSSKLGASQAATATNPNANTTSTNTGGGTVTNKTTTADGFSGLLSNPYVLAAAAFLGYKYFSKK